jgi:hypothetical protein
MIDFDHMIKRPIDGAPSLPLVTCHQLMGHTLHTSDSFSFGELRCNVNTKSKQGWMKASARSILRRLTETRMVESVAE